MDELVERPAARSGIGSAVAEKTVGIALGLLRGEDRGDQVRPLIDAIPGSEAGIAVSERRRAPSGTIGPGLNEFQNTARELFRFGRDKIGAEHMSEIISGTPGLGQFA